MLSAVVCCLLFGDCRCWLSVGRRALCVAVRCLVFVVWCLMFVLLRLFVVCSVSVVFVVV